MSKSAIDATFSTEIFRNDATLVIAKRRDLAALSPVRLALKSGGYKAGTVIARNTATGLFEAFSAASGSYTAQKILFERVREEELGATGGALARALDAGYVYKDSLTDYDSTAKTHLGAIEQTDATGVTIVKF